MAIWMALFCVIIAVVFNTMHDVLKRRWFGELRQTLTQSGLVFGTIVVYLFSVKDSELYSRLTLWVTLIVYCALAYAVRTLWKRLLRRLLRKRPWRARLQH